MSVDNNYCDLHSFIRAMSECMNDSKEICNYRYTISLIDMYNSMTDYCTQLKLKRMIIPEIYRRSDNNKLIFRIEMKRIRNYKKFVECVKRNSKSIPKIKEHEISQTITIKI